jgi:hypothetical protein
LRAISGLWRWRHNPLRRGTDLAEAWAALLTLLLMLVAAPLAGAFAADATHDLLRHAADSQRASRHTVVATVVRKLPAASVDPESGAPVGPGSHSRVVADWAAPDHSTRRSPVTAELRDPQRGDRFTVWTDDQGRLVARPMDATAVAGQAVLCGAAAALLAASVAEGGRRLTVRRLLQRRYQGWDRAWERSGPDWGRTGTGS